MDSTKETDSTGTAELPPTAGNTALYGGDTAQRFELETRSKKEHRSFLSLLSGLFFVVVGVKRVPTVQTAS